MFFKLYCCVLINIRLSNVDSKDTINLGKANQKNIFSLRRYIKMDNLLRNAMQNSLYESLNWGS